MYKIIQLSTEESKMTKKLKFDAELLDSGKILIRCSENNDATTAGHPVTIGRFIQKQLGINDADPDPEIKDPEKKGE